MLPESTLRWLCVPASLHERTRLRHARLRVQPVRGSRSRGECSCFSFSVSEIRGTRHALLPARCRRLRQRVTREERARLVRGGCVSSHMKVGRLWHACPPRPDARAAANRLPAPKLKTVCPGALQCPIICSHDTADQVACAWGSAVSMQHPTEQRNHAGTPDRRVVYQASNKSRLSNSTLCIHAVHSFAVHN